MSVNRRRWSNELVNSLMDFQSKEASQLSHSVNEKCTDITSMFASLQKQKSSISVRSKGPSEESSSSTLVLSDSGNRSQQCRPSNEVVSNNMIEDILILEKTSATISDFNEKMQNHIESSSDNETLQPLSNCSHQLFTESENSQSSNKSLKELIASDINEINEKIVIVEPKNMSSEIGTSVFGIEEFPTTYNLKYQKNDNISSKLCSPLEFPKINQTMIADINKPDFWDALIALDEVLSPAKKYEEDKPESSQNPSMILNRLSQKFKQTPTRFTEKLVSILEDSVLSIESPTKPYNNDTSAVSLCRITGEFRKLCKFIDGFIDDESMPSLMDTTNSCFEKTETPEYQNDDKIISINNSKMPYKTACDIPSHQSTPLALKILFPPKNKILTNVHSPINHFSPSADKSFEYWEKVCNIMCDNQGSAKKNIAKILPLDPESPRLSMEEILNICERQMASLDESTLEPRTSEPCKKIESEVKLKVLSMPRSKSASKIYSTGKKMKQSTSKDKIDKVREKLVFDVKLPLSEIPLDRMMEKKANEKEDSDFEKEVSDENTPNKCLEKYYERLSAQNRTEEMKELLLNLSQVSQSTLSANYDEEDKENYDPSLNESSLDKEYEALKKRISEEIEQREFEDDFKMISYSPQETESESIAEDDQDCSLLIELAKRRQRCLETAKLMMEIESDDPVTTEDKKCLETLYKLGIQDKTFAEVEDDTKFLKTLNQCMEYKNYLGNQSKPLINVLQKYDSPDDLKKKTTSLINSKKYLNQTGNNNVSTTKKPSLERKSTLRVLQEKKMNEQKMTPRLIPKKVGSRINPKVERIPTSNLKNTKTNARVASKTAPKAVSQHKNTPRPENHLDKVLRTPSLSKSIATIRSESKASLLRKPLPAPTSPKPIPLKATISTPRSVLKSSKLTLLKEQKPISTAKLPLVSPKRIPLHEQVKKVTPKITSNINLTHQSDALDESSIRRDGKSPPRRPKFFFTPGKSPMKAMTSARKKPASYFTDFSTKVMSPKKRVFNPADQKNALHCTQQKTFDSVKSPISLYIKATDNDLIQNVQGRINDRLLTPVSKGEDGQSPALKFRLSSKDNQSPTITCDENIVLPTVRYHSAKKVRLIGENQYYSPITLTPKSRTKKLLEPVENTLIIRHEGRVVEAFKPNYLDAETSIRVQKVAEKASSLKKLI